MNFYEDFLKNQKKNSQVNNGLADTWQKLKPALPKNAPKAQMQKTEKQTITSSAPKISNAINIFPKGQSFEAPRKPKTLIGNRNAKNEIVKLPYKPDTLNGKPKISKLPYRPYKPDSLNGNSGFGKLPDFNREKPKIDKGFTKYPYYTREGLRIKNNVQSIIKNRIGELDSRHVFDGIDDDTIERNKPVAQAAIEDNVSRGLLTQEQLKKYPNLIDGLTMFYAAGEKGKPKAQNLARSVAYSESAPEKQTLLDYSPDSAAMTNYVIDKQAAPAIAGKSDDIFLYSGSNYRPDSNTVFNLKNMYDVLKEGGSKLREIVSDYWLPSRISSSIENVNSIGNFVVENSKAAEKIVNWMFNNSDADSTEPMTRKRYFEKANNNTHIMYNCTYKIKKKE